ncbi:MAG: AlwI family type II restriction endonuclease, partial [Planctomycetia bacterium]|nr:AlwI family type II restriction endonuclease [Planctomycetia bacterium]
ADIPTIFEYLLAILWYKVSEYEGKILDYMKLSLDADLLPKTHAGGGEADIVYEYQKSSVFPEHSLLLEATLADSTNQRRMEMEPVSRHLGKHLLRTGNLSSYCVFVTNDLNINGIADFRSRKNNPWFDPLDYERYVTGMKIIPLKIADLKQILRQRRTYKELYLLFEEAHSMTALPPVWYETYIKHKLCETI